jgi:hypothetical protein
MNQALIVFMKDREVKQDQPGTRHETCNRFWQLNAG